MQKPGTSDLKALWERAQAHAAQREWAQAIACFNAILARRPGDPVVLTQVSYMSSLAGHYRAARSAALQAAVARPMPPQAVGELLPRLRTFNEAGAFHRVLEALGTPARIPIPMLLSCAAQLSYFNEQERALEYLDEARRADPDYPAALLARAQVLTYLARFDEAEADLDRVLRRAPELAQTYWLLSRLRRWDAGRNHVDAIRAQLARPGRSGDDLALLGFALHKELDDLGDHEAAALALGDACRAKRSTLRYDPAESRQLVDALIAADEAAPRDTTAAGPGARTPVFIAGMHRSGTTLLEQLLDGHPDVRGIGELYDFTAQMRYATDHHCRGVVDATIAARAGGVDFAAVGLGYLERMEWRLGAERCFTDKLPSNFLNIGFICRALPQARILHMVRDPVEVCFSNLRELFSDANPYSYDQLELADYYHQYRRLMDHWRKAWPGRILDVGYTELTRAPEATMRRVAEFCGLAFEPAMLDIGARRRGVATASAVQVREGIVARERPKWAPYEAWLQPLIHALG
jgi:tetratricopeptide (TPR) repeat protein